MSQLHNSQSTCDSSMTAPYHSLRIARASRTLILVIQVRRFDSISSKKPVVFLVDVATKHCFRFTLVERKTSKSEILFGGNKVICDCAENVIWDSPIIELCDFGSTRNIRSFHEEFNGAGDFGLNRISRAVFIEFLLFRELRWDFQRIPKEIISIANCENKVDCNVSWIVVDGLGVEVIVWSWCNLCNVCNVRNSVRRYHWV